MTADPNASSGTPAEVLRVRGVVKRFGATTALAGVDLDVHAGEFLALLGPNGAGKSTLIRLLDGVDAPTEGTIEVVGASRLGVVHQDLGLVGTMTVAENLFLGRSRSRMLHLRQELDECARALSEVGIDDIDPLALVDGLGLGEQAMVAVAKLLHAGADVVIVDEVTAGLSESESRWLVDRLRGAARAGAAVVMVTHKLREVEGAADRYVVLVDGRVVVDRPAALASMAEIATVMAASGQRQVARSHAAAPDGRARHGEVVCRVVGVRRGRVGPVELSIAAGDVIGLTGTVRSGLHDLAYVVAGILRPDAGHVQVEKGVRRACVPAHRETEGVFPTETEEFNLTAGLWGRWRSRSGLLSPSRIAADCAEMAEHLALIPRDLHAELSQLSGGNQQKAVLGRALLGRPDLLVLCEPTRGVDVGTRREIYRQVRAAATDGLAVVVASTDLEDLVELADRAAVLEPTGALGPWVTRAQIPSLAAAVV